MKEQLNFKFNTESCIKIIYYFDNQLNQILNSIFFVIPIFFFNSTRAHAQGIRSPSFTLPR